MRHTTESPDIPGRLNIDRATAGTTTIGITQPTGWTQPANGRTSILATVTPPGIQIGGTFTVPAGSERTAYTRLLIAPPSATPLTLSLASGSTALLSTTPGGTGSTSLTFEDVTNSGWNYFYVQGIAPGTTTLTVSAPGYADETGTITVTP